MHSIFSYTGSLLISTFFQDETLQFYSKYSEEQLLPIMRKMAYLVAKAGSGKLTAIHLKYQSSKFMRISVAPELKCQTIVDMAAEHDK